MRKLWWIAGLAVSVLITCNYDEGECWIEGQGNGSVGAGGGPILPGAGGFGDVPPEPQDAADPPPDCDPGNDGATELGQITCGAPSWGPTCMELCATSGVACPAGVKHTVTNKLVLLYKCCACKGKQECWYVDPDDLGKVCVSRPGLPKTGPTCI